MANVSKGKTFSSVEQVTASKLHQLVDSATVTAIVNADVDAAAGIVDTKLAQIATAGKVSGAALTGLASIPAGAGVVPAANLTSVAQKGANTDITSLSMLSTVNPTNLLSNGDFEAWSAGTSAAPDGWTTTFTGSSAVARESSIIKLGTYSTKLVRDGGTCFIYQDIHATKGIAYWKGRTVTLGAWVYATSANKARLNMEDGVTDHYSSYHTGDSTWQWITTTMTVGASGTRIRCSLDISADATAYFDGAILVEGSSAFAFSPKPLAVDNLSATFKDINPTNLLSNGDMESWSAGTSSAPDGWTAGGVGVAVAREGTIIKLGTYSAKVTRNSNNCNINQSIHTTRGITYWKGRTVTCGAWVYATVANRGRVIIDDGVGTGVSSWHTGDSTWQWLTATRTINSSATQINIQLTCEDGDTSTYFDGAICVEGSSAFAFSPKPAEEGVWADYSATSTVVGWSEFTTKQIYTKKIGKTVFVWYVLDGTSNSATTTFTVPYNGAGMGTYFIGGAVDNGGTRVSGFVAKGASDNIVTLYKDMAAAGWTNSGTKNTNGFVVYESA